MTGCPLGSCSAGRLKVTCGMSSLSALERAARRPASTSRVWGGRCCLSSAENFFIMILPSCRGVPFSWTGDPETALNHGWWPRPFYYREEEDGAAVPTRPPIGSGAGGSTAQFGAVMDRFRPQDFTPRRFFPDMPDASLPEAWPVSYEEMVPFYERAESLYRVRGTQDPLASTAS